jgi:hypothetical protein
MVSVVEAEIDTSLAEDGSTLVLLYVGLFPAAKLVGFPVAE